MELKKIAKKIIGRDTLRAYHISKSNFDAWRYRYPSHGMTVIGVTGTNGKTTTCNLIASIFEAAGKKVALATTIQFRVDGKEKLNDTKMTTLDSKDFNRFLVKANHAGCTHLIVEVTSISLDQQRVAGVNFDTAVLTNITHDHLDYHGTFDEYVQAKRNLFARDLRVSVLNWDDPNGREFGKLAAAEHIYYSLNKDEKTIYPMNVEESNEKSRFRVNVGNRTLEIETTLLGSFNRQNILAAVAVGLGHGISDQDIVAGVANLKSVKGRMEVIEEGQPFTVIVDYAHTPDALEKLYQAIKPAAEGHRIISILGSCGDRDKTKRPVLGSIAGREADYVIVTNEDPYTEDPQFIIDSVASGVVKGRDTHAEGKTYWRIFDRGEAIAKGISLAQPGDVITITGKGAETAMVWGRQHRPWSDQEETRRALRKLLGKS